MKKYIIGLILIFASAFSYAQENTEAKIAKESEMDSIFIKNPSLYINTYRSDRFSDTKLMYETYELTNRVWEYQDKQVKGMAWGGGLMAIGGLGWAYTLWILDPPVYQTSNQGLNKKAEDAKRNQQIAGWISTAIFASGATIFSISFKNHKRIRAEVGLANLKLHYRLFGEQLYYKGIRSKKMKNRGLYPTRTRKKDD